MTIDNFEDLWFSMIDSDAELVAKAVELGTQLSGEDFTTWIAFDAYQRIISTIAFTEQDFDLLSAFMDARVVLDMVHSTWKQTGTIDLTPIREWIANNTEICIKANNIACRNTVAVTEANTQLLKAVLDIE